MTRPPAVWPDAAAAFFAACLERSDYAATVGRALREALAPVTSLVDIGTGSGMLARAMLQPGALLEVCRGLARRAVAWVVPAQAGPRGPCLSGLLPPHLHGEDETPGVDLTLAALDRLPDRRRDVDWTFRALFPDRAAARRYFIDHYGDRLGGEAELDAVLAPHLTAVAGGLMAEVRKRSAILIWTVSGETDA